VSKPISVMRFAETVDQLLRAGEKADGDDLANESNDGPGPTETGGEES
jgi:hypothetical protein